MIDLTRIDSHGVVVAYLRERHRRSAVRSLTGKDPDVPSSTAPPDGVWEALLGLMRGVPRHVVEALHLLSYGYAGCQWTEGHMRDEEGDPMYRKDGKPIIEGEFQALPLTKAATARYLGMNKTTLKKEIDDAYNQVGENVAILRVRSRGWV